MQKMKKKRKNPLWPLILVFFLGLGVLAYPVISRLYYETQATSAISDFTSETSTLDKSELDERMKLAHAYNDALITGSLSDPYSEEHKAGVAAYARMLEVHEKIGFLQIPRINVEIPIYAGTSETVLQKGIGHLEGTSLPVGGNSTHAVLTAHRGLPNARLFSELDQMQVGDKFFVHNLSGTLAYQVDQILTIEPSDLSELLVVAGHDYVTLLTCTPYMVNSHRLLVRGHQIPYVAAVEERMIAESKSSYFYKYAFYISFGILLAVLFSVFLDFVYRKKAKKKSSLPPHKDHEHET